MLALLLLTIGAVLAHAKEPAPSLRPTKLAKTTKRPTKQPTSRPTPRPTTPQRSSTKRPAPQPVAAPECEASSCLHGACEGTVCKCDRGWKGVKCEVDACATHNACKACVAENYVQSHRPGRARPGPGSGRRLAETGVCTWERETEECVFSLTAPLAASTSAAAAQCLSAPPPPVESEASEFAPPLSPVAAVSVSTARHPQGADEDEAYQSTQFKALFWVVVFVFVVFPISRFIYHTRVAPPPPPTPRQTTEEEEEAAFPLVVEMVPQVSWQDNNPHASNNVPHPLPPQRRVAD